MKINNMEEFVNKVKERVKEIITVDGGEQDSLDNYVEYIIELYLKDTRIQEIIGEIGGEVVVDEVVEIMVTAVVNALLQLDMVAEKYVDVND